MKPELIDEKLLPPKGVDMLCNNLVNTKYDDLSEDNIRIYKDRLLDMTGCIFGGAVVPEDRFYYDMLIRQGGIPEAPLFANSGRLPVISAVMHNCLRARANDFGNMVTSVFGEAIASHYGETVIPMNLTLADMYGISGKEFITNNIAAEDTVARLVYTLPVRWPVDMYLVSSAATALASRYYKLDAEQTKTALSYAAANATDPAAAYYEYCQEFKLHNAESARVGILACELTKGGWTGMADPYFGRWGIISQRAPEGELPDLYVKAFDDLGRIYYTESRFKRGPGGIPTTVAQFVGKALHEKIIEAYGKLEPENIKQVRCYPSTTMRPNYYFQPFTQRNHTNALFCYRFSTVCAMLYGAVRVDLVQTEAILADPILIELAENATLDTFECEPGTQKYKARVEMKDGRVFEETQDYNAIPSTYPEREVIISKFRDQFSLFGKLHESTGDKIIELAAKIETLSDMREYTELLVIK